MNILRISLILCFLSASGLYPDTSPFPVCPALGADLDIEANGKLHTDTFSFKGQSNVSATAGRVFYDQDDGAKQLYLYDGTNWRRLNQARTVATRIVAAYNSSGSKKPNGTPCSGLGGKCRNPKAHYTCNGNDDQTTIQAAIDDLGSNPGVVYLLEGEYKLSAPIEFDDITPDDSNKALIGAGAGTLLLSSSSQYPSIWVSSSSGILISNLSIKYQGIRGINATMMSNSHIEGVWIENDASDNASAAISLGIDCVRNVIRGNYIIDGDNIGISLTSSTARENIIVDNIIVKNKKTAIAVGGDDTRVLGNVIFGKEVNSSDYLIDVSTPGNTILGNNLSSDNQGGGGIKITHANNIISSNNIQDNKTHGLWIRSSNGRDNIVAANNIQGNKMRGIFISQGSGNLISANIVDDNGAANNRDGILISGAASQPSDNNFISANRIYDSRGSGYGININNANCNDSYLVANYIDGPGYINANASPPYDRRINDRGADTVYTDKRKIALASVSYTPSTGTAIPVTSPASYLRLTPGANVKLGDDSCGSDAIENGKSPGDVLVLENTDMNKKVKIFDGCNVSLTKPKIELKKNQALKLIWDGANWIQAGYGKNKD